MQDEHIDQYMALSDDPELTATMGWEPFGASERERFAEFTRVLSVPGLVDRKAVVFSIIKAADNRAIGYTSIKGISESDGRAEIGIAIMAAEYRGQGYGTETMHCVADYAFNKLGLTRLYLTVFPSNQRAIRAYEKVGFQKTMILKDSWLLPSGEYADMWLMELSRDQLPRRKGNW